MDYVKRNLPRSEVEIEVTVPVAEWEPSIKKAAELISQEVKIEGFRPGKAPFDVVKSKVGEMKILERAAELAARKVYPEVVAKEFPDDGSRGTPIGQPSVTITKLAVGNDLMLKVVAALLPVIDLPDYAVLAKRVAKERKPVLVSDEEVTKALNWLREARAVYTSVERVAGKDDRVEIDYEIRSGGVKIEGGESKNHPLIIGKGKFIPGFEDELIGMKKGEEKSFTLAVPADWYQSGIAGKSIEAKVLMGGVEEARVPDLTDEFAKGLGGFGDVLALTKSIRDGLMTEKEGEEDKRIKNRIIEAIAKETKFEVPEILIQSEIEKMARELKHGIEHMGLSWETYLSQIKKSPEELVLAWRPDAEKRARIALVIREIGTREHIEPAGEEIEARTRQYLAQFKTPDEAAKNIDPREIREYTRGVLRNEMVFERLEKLAQE